MKLSDIRAEVDSYTGGASSVNRQMALAGIAVIWIIVKEDSDVAIQNGALWIFVASLSADLMQYILGAISSKVLDIKKQIELKRLYNKDDVKIEADDFEISSWWHVPTWLCFFAKIILVIWGYFSLLQQLPIPLS
ncbi:hypothetical protein AB4517_04195 [Vibrio sp. 10N.222.52.C3]|uniref:hypothetical protein n=1 Tax=Vibrio sp. 10N.222.52.C3 TaxID=3229631 RepID=UPI00354DB65A